MTFVYGNTVTADVLKKKDFCYFFDITFKLLLLYIDHVPGNQVPIPVVYNFIMLLLYFFIYGCSSEQINDGTKLSHIFNKKYSIKKA